MCIKAWCPDYRPDGAEHGGECEERGHGHGDPAGDGLGREEEGEPGHDDEQTCS